jgi:hypothetical protein
MESSAFKQSLLGASGQHLRLLNLSLAAYCVSSKACKQSAVATILQMQLTSSASQICFHQPFAVIFDPSTLISISPSTSTET